MINDKTQTRWLTHTQTEVSYIKIGSSITKVLIHSMSLPLEAPRTVQVTQTGLTTGVGMNEPSKALGTKRGLAVVCTETTNWPWLLLKFDLSTRTLPNPIFYKFCNPTSNTHNTYHLSNLPNSNQHSPNYYFIPI